MRVRFLLLLDVGVASGLGRRQRKTAGAVVSDAEAARISTSSSHMITQSVVMKTVRFLRSE